MPRPARLAAAVLLAGALACGASTSTPASGSTAAPTLAFTVQPADTSAGAPFGVTVRVADAAGAPAAGVTVTLALAAGPAGAALGGTTSHATDAAGLAAFTGLTLTRAGAGYRLTAAGGGAHADSATFTISPGAPHVASSTLAGPAGSVVADGTATGTVTATVRDAHANPVPGVSVSFAAPGATLSAASATTDAAGVASVTVRATSAGTVTVTASFGGGSRQVDVVFTATPPTLAFTVQPADTTAGASFDVTVAATNAAGAPVAGVTVALALAGGPGGATLGGITSRTTSAAGLAAFTGLTVTRAGAGYRLSATGGGAQADSATFAISPGAPDVASSTLAGPAGSVVADGTATGTVTATVRDAHANPVPGVSVSFTAPGATLSAASATTNAAGVASVTVRATSAGTVTVTASFGGGSRQVGVTFVAAVARWVMGYYVGYERDLYPPESVDYSAMTHVAVGALLPNADGTVLTHFFIDDVQGPEMAATVAARAHAAGRSAILMVGGAGFGDGFRSAASSAHRDAFVANLVAAMDDLGFDGFDLDWEPLEQTDMPDLLALAAALRAARPGLTLTVPVSWVNANFGAETWLAPLANAFDQINIMSYEMADNWGGWVAWHHAALDGEAGDHPSSVSSSADAYAAIGIPKAKIGIGLGFYGSCWRGVTAPLQALTGSAGVWASDGEMSYRNIMASYHAAAAYHWDATASMGYLSFASPTGPAQCNLVSYEDAASIAAKGQWVRDNGYGGTIIWTVAQGATSPGGPNPPLAAVKSAFLP